MKTLIIESIRLHGIGHTDVKTIFNITSDIEKKHPKYKYLSDIAGKTTYITFSYLEKNNVMENEIVIKLKKSRNENEIKKFIIDKINKTLK